MCVQTGSVKEHLTGKVIPKKIREYMGSRRTEYHKRNYEKSGRSVKDENRCLHPTDNLVGWPRFYASFDNGSIVPINGKDFKIFAEMGMPRYIMLFVVFIRLVQRL